MGGYSETPEVASSNERVDACGAAGSVSCVPPGGLITCQEVIRGLSEGVAVHDTRGRLLYCNPAFGRLLGLSAEQLRGDAPVEPGWRLVAEDGTPLLTPRPPAEGPGFVATWLCPLLGQGATAPASASSVIARAVRPDGSEAWLSVSCQPLVQPGVTEPYAIVTSYVDVTERKRTEEQLLWQKTILEAQTEASNDGILMIRADCTILSFNRRFAELWGFPPRLRVGASLDDAIGEALQVVENPREFHALVQSILDQRDESSQATIALRDGRTFAVYSVPVKRSDGRYSGRVSFLRDITQQKRAQEALEQLSQRSALVLNSAGDGIIGLDVEGRVTFANPSAARMTGFKVEELLGQRFHDLVHHTHPDGTPYAFADCPAQRVIQTGSPRRVSGELFWRKDGTSFPVEYVSAPIPDDKTIVGTVVTFKDISERLAVERMKDEFISVVSHELRTPLTSIRGSLGLLASGLMGPLPERAQRMLEIAVKNTDRLVNLINDILDIERIESGKVTMQKRDCDAADLVAQAAELVQPLAEKAGVTLSVAPLAAPLFADPDRVIQVLTNLLGNAVKFSYPGGKIWLDAERRDDQIVFRVRDQGRGIPPDKLETIFERFQQVDTSDSREKGGTGLGLAICRSIAHQHGGRVWAETGREPLGPGLGPGSTFYFALPVVLGPERTICEAPSAFGPILICDDDPGIRAVIRAILETRGYGVIPAATGRDAVALAVEHRPRAILLDLLMPGMNGWETMAALKARPETRAIPIIILSVFDPGEEESSRLPVARWLRKPVSEDSLFRALDEVVERATRAPRVLIVEDDQDLAQVLTAMFQRHGVETFQAQTGREAIALSQCASPDLLVLDLILPEGDGFGVVDWLRRQDRLRQVSLVVYSAKDLTEADRARLKLNTTEFLTKGRISPEEFEQRVIGLLNRIVAPTLPCLSTEGVAVPGASGETWDLGAELIGSETEQVALPDVSGVSWD